MYDVQISRFTLETPDGNCRQVDFGQDSALIGSGPQCDLRLAPEDVAAEQLELFIRNGRLVGKVRTLERPTLLNGVPFVEGPILAESTFRLGRVSLRLEVGEASPRLSLARKQERTGNQLVYLLGAVGFPLGFYALLTGGPQVTALPVAVEPPALWSGSQQACPHMETGAAVSFGRQELQRAQAARERAPFSGGDGVQAVRSFQSAALCLRHGGKEGEAEAAAAAGESMKELVDREFQIHGIALERALARERYAEAGIEVRRLLQFVGGDAGQYRTWLLTLQRQIELKFAGKKS